MHDGGLIPCSQALEHVIWLPGVTPYDTSLNSGLDGRLLTVRDHERIEMSMSQRSGGPGVESARRRSRAAFRGNLACTLPAVYANLEGVYAGGFPHNAYCRRATLPSSMWNKRDGGSPPYSFPTYSNRGGQSVREIDEDRRAGDGVEGGGGIEGNEPVPNFAVQPRPQGHLPRHRP